MNLQKGATLPVPKQDDEDKFYFSIVDDNEHGFWLGIQKSNGEWKTDSGLPVTYGIYGDEDLPWRHSMELLKYDDVYASGFREESSWTGDLRDPKWYTWNEDEANGETLNTICTYVCRLHNIY